jgi:hypothetical protein
MDWKKLIAAVAPSLGTALGGPLAGAAVKVLGDQILGNEDASEDEVAAAVVKGLSPEHIVALKQADQSFAIRMRELDIDLSKLNAETEKAYLADTQDARKAHGSDAGVFWLGISILITFGGVMGAVLWGSFELMTGGITVKDVAIVGMVSGLIGTVVGYVAANAQQVVAYFFGSSRGSAAKTDAMAAAVDRLGRR